MTQLLHISSSPRGSASESRAVANAFLESFRAENPDVKVEELDLFDGSLPTFGRLAAGAKMAIFAGGQPSPEQATEWSRARAVFDRFASADAYLFSVPMWNSGIPYVLKQWIDIVTQPGWVFGFSPETGYEGLIKGKRAAVVYVSGVYSLGAPLAFGADFHSTYFHDWLRFAGFAETDVVELRFQPTVLTATPQDDRAAAIAAARNGARRLFRCDGPHAQRRSVEHRLETFFELVLQGPVVERHNRSTSLCRIAKQCCDVREGAAFQLGLTKLDRRLYKLWVASSLRPARSPVVSWRPLPNPPRRLSRRRRWRSGGG